MTYVQALDWIGYPIRSLALKRFDFICSEKTVCRNNNNQQIYLPMSGLSLPLLKQVERNTMRIKTFCKRVPTVEHRPTICCFCDMLLKVDHSHKTKLVNNEPSQTNTNNFCFEFPGIFTKCQCPSQSLWQLYSWNLLLREHLLGLYRL
jgi:hypothetical protein